MTDIHLHDPQTLYRHWEGEQWNPWEIDLAADRRQWANGLSDEDKGLVYWALSSLMVAEERITTKFAGLVMAGDSEEETTFLATQQVDEARHMQFYARFQDEVVAEPETIATHVARSREQLGEPFSVIFDQALVPAHDRLVDDPHDPAAKVDFVTTYHLVIESTLGLTAFEFITRYLGDKELLPGFVEGYTHIHHDEQRHIGYGIWFLREAAARDPGAGRPHTPDPARAAAVGRLRPGPARPRRHGLGGAGRFQRGDPRLRPERTQAAAQHRRRPAGEPVGLERTVRRRDSAGRQCPNQRARRLAPKCCFSATRASDGAWKVPVGFGPERKSTSTRPTRPPPNSM